MKAQITKDTFISGKPVKKGQVIDIDDATFRTLKLCNSAEPAKAEPVKEAEKPAATKKENK